jgi:hypothetical protein
MPMLDGSPERFVEDHRCESLKNADVDKPNLD